MSTAVASRLSEEPQSSCVVYIALSLPENRTVKYLRHSKRVQDEGDPDARVRTCSLRTRMQPAQRKSSPNPLPLPRLPPFVLSDLMLHLLHPGGGGSLS